MADVGVVTTYAVLDEYTGPAQKILDRIKVDLKAVNDAVVDASAGLVSAASRVIQPVSAAADKVAQWGQIADTAVAKVGKVGEGISAFGNKVDKQAKKVTEFGEHMSTLGGKFGELAKKLSGAGGPAATLGSVLGQVAPVLTEVGEGAQLVGGKLGEWASTISSVGGEVSSFVGDVQKVTKGFNEAFGGAREMVGQFSSVKEVFRSVAGGAKAFGSALISIGGRALGSVITGIRMLGVALLTNPIGLVLTTIGAVAGLIYANWETVGPWFARLWEGIKTIAASVWQWIQGALAWTPLGVIIANWEPIKAWFGALWENLKGNVAWVWEWIKTAFAWSPLGLLVENWEPLKTWFGDLWDGIKQTLSGAWEWIKKTLLSPIQSVREAMGDAWDKVVGFFSSDSEVNVNKQVQNAQSGVAATVTTAPVKVKGTAGPTTVTVNSPITVNAAPGMDEKRLAELVDQRLGQAVRRSMIEAREAHG